MNNENLFIYIKNLKYSDIKFKLINISYGDKYYTENGQEFQFEILGKNYQVGYSYITEDDDNWGQAECYSNDWTICDDIHIDADEVLDLIKNYKQLVRDNNLSKVFNI